MTGVLTRNGKPIPTRQCICVPGTRPTVTLATRRHLAPTTTLVLSGGGRQNAGKERTAAGTTTTPRELPSTAPPDSTGP